MNEGGVRRQGMVGAVANGGIGHLAVSRTLLAQHIAGIKFGARGAADIQPEGAAHIGLQ